MPQYKVPAKPKRNGLQKSYLILKYAHDTSESLLKTFEVVRKARAKKGRPTDEEQDLLRAMLVFAGAGLDGMVKQVIKDVMPRVLNDSEAARKEFEKFISKKLQRFEVEEESSPTEAGLNIKLMSRVLSSEKPRDVLIQVLVADLTSGSLQSAEELLRVLAYLGVEAKSVGVTVPALKPVFHCRNLLIHELDIDFKQKNANRFPRKRDDMVAHTKTLLDVGAKVLDAVDSSLTPLT